MKKWLLLIILFAFMDIPAQENETKEKELKDYVHLSGNIYDFVDQERLDYFEVRVIIDTEIILSERYHKQTNFNLKLPYGFEYTVIFFARNYVSRKVLIDIMDIPFANKKIYPLELDLGLLAKRKGQKTREISKSYSGIARYSPTKDQVEWLPKQKERIDQIISNKLTAKGNEDINQN